MIAKELQKPSPSRGAESPWEGLRPWFRLALGIILILVFMFGVGSLALWIPGARHMARVIDERGLRATAVYYTDFDEPAEGSATIRDSLDYTPTGNNSGKTPPMP